jgi:hypothetical protein
LPGTQISMETKAEVAWTAEGGHAGLRFVDLTINSRKELEQWLCKQSVEKGA